MKMFTLEEVQKQAEDMEVKWTKTVGPSWSDNTRTQYCPLHGASLFTEDCLPRNWFKQATCAWWADFQITMKEARRVKEQYGDKVRFEPAWYAEDGRQMLFFLELNDIIKWLYESKRFDFLRKGKNESNQEQHG